MKVNGEALRVIRERTGISATQLSTMTGIRTETICRLELGRRPGTEEQIVKLARALEVPDNAITVPVDYTTTPPVADTADLDA